MSFFQEVFWVILGRRKEIILMFFVCVTEMQYVMASVENFYEDVGKMIEKVINYGF